MGWLLKSIPPLDYIVELYPGYSAYLGDDAGAFYWSITLSMLLSPLFVCLLWRTDFGRLEYRQKFICSLVLIPMFILLGGGSIMTG